MKRRSVFQRAILFTVISSMAGVIFMPSSYARPEKKALLTVICSANRHGELEPCGCSAKQNGGVQIESSYIVAAKGEKPPLLLLDAGGFIGLKVSDNDYLKTIYLFEAMAKMGYQTINVGCSDMSFGLDFLRKTAQKHSFTFVSCNIVDPQTLRPLFLPYVIKEFLSLDGGKLCVAVTGFTKADASPMLRAKLDLAGITAGNPGIPLAPEDTVVPGSKSHSVVKGDPVNAVADPMAIQCPQPTGQEFTSADPQAALAELVPALRQVADFVIVLANDDPTNVEMVVQAVNGIDLVYYGNALSVPSVPVKRNGALVHRVGFRGQALGRALVAQDERGPLDITATTIPINGSLKPDPDIAAIIDHYKADTKRLFTERPVVSDRTLAGHEACIACHPAQHDQWETTKHSKAVQTLIQKNQQYNPDCLPCHTTSYRTDNGFYDIHTTPEFANVQCEMCHGPALEHVNSMRMLNQAAHVAGTQRNRYQQVASENLPKRRPDSALCVKCHNEEKDPNFDFKSFLQRVSH